MNEKHIPRQLFLVRHGEATSKDEDPERPLTSTGRSEVASVADWAASIGIRIDEIRHSGKFRAQQTAEIFAERLAAAPPQVASGLAPNDDVVPIGEALQHGRGNVMLVGHLPFLSRLAALLLAGDAERNVVSLDAGALIGLCHTEDGWTAVCLLQPKLLSQS